MKITTCDGVFDSREARTRSLYSVRQGDWMWGEGFRSVGKIEQVTQFSGGVEFEIYWSTGKRARLVVNGRSDRNVYCVS